MCIRGQILDHRGDAHDVSAVELDCLTHYIVTTEEAPCDRSRENDAVRPAQGVGKATDDGSHWKELEEIRIHPIRRINGAVNATVSKSDLCPLEPRRRVNLWKVQLQHLRHVGYGLASMDWGATGKR